MFRFIHTADIHLDSPLHGLERYEGAPVERIRNATRQALKNLVDLALAEEVALVLISGDLYDGDWKDYNTGLFFAAEMSRLREAGIRVVLISGNHDALSQITRQLRMPDHVVRLSSKKPQTLRIETCGVAVHGQSFPRAAVTDDLTTAYPEPLAGYFNIGMLHTSASGREGHEPYAPCSLEGLVARGYDYWALGHVHSREILCEEPFIVFPGNIQGRHIRETGPKGCTVVSVEDGRVVSLEHRELDVLRWSLKRVDASGCETAEEVVDRVCRGIKEESESADGRLLAVRLHLVGSCRAHADLMHRHERWISEIRMAATDVSGGTAWVEKVLLRTALQADLDEMLARDDPIGGLLRSLQALSGSDESLVELMEELSDFRRKLPSELLHGDEAIDLEYPERRREIVEDVKQILIGRLLSQVKE